MGATPSTTKHANTSSLFADLQEMTAERRYIKYKDKQGLSYNYLDNAKHRQADFVFTLDESQQ